MEDLRSGHRRIACRRQASRTRRGVRAAIFARAFSRPGGARLAAAAKALLFALLCVTAALPGGVAAADYPSKPITLVVPFAPGGFVHTVAMMLGESMTELLGQSVVVLNRPGANGNLAAATIAKADPDGYTIFLPTASILTINPHLYTNIQFDPLTDFVPVAMVTSTSNLFVVSPNSGIKTFKDLVDRARANPDTVSYGSTGSGSIQHIAGEALRRQANVKLLHVPYKGVAPALVDVLGDRLTVLFSDATAIPYVKSGRLTALAVSPKKLDDLANVPSLAEAAAAAGVPQYTAPALWYGVVAPKGTPKDVVAKLNAAVTQTLKRKEVREKLLAAGALPAEDTSSEFLSRTMQSDYASYGVLLKSLNITVE